MTVPKQTKVLSQTGCVAVPAATPIQETMVAYNEEELQQWPNCDV